MKIAFDAKRAYNNKSGLGNYSRDIIRAVIQKHEDHLYLFSPKINTEIFNIQPLVSDLSTVEEIQPTEPIDRFITGYWRSFSIIKDIHKRKIDLFHGLSNELPFTLGNTIKKVVTIHDLIFKRYPQWYKAIDRKIYDWKFKLACNNADKIIAISEQTKADIMNFYQIDESKIEVVYQTCNDSFKNKATQEQVAAVRKKYQLPNEFLLNVGTIETRKNALNIVKALHQKNINTPLYIIGRNTEYANEIKAYINQNNLEKQIQILHNVSNEELPVFYQLAKIFIYPSTFEGFGIPIIEALYSGTPVITSKGSCFSEPGGENSVYVEVGNIDELGEAITNLLTDPKKCTMMIEKGLVHVQEFSTKKVTEDLYEIYTQLLK